MLDGLCCCTRASRVAASEDCSCLGAWASHCWLLLSRSASSGRMASAVAAHRLRSCDLQALGRKLSSVAMGLAAAEHAESSPTRGGTRVPCAYCKVESHPLGHQGSPRVYFETWPLCSFFFFFIYLCWRLITLQYCHGFCHTLIWISHGFTCVPHPEPPSHLPPYPISLGHCSSGSSFFTFKVIFIYFLCIKVNTYLL